MQEKERLEKLLAEKEDLKKKIRELKAKISKKERKKRTRQLIQIGGLAEIAELTNTDRGIILGGLLEISETIKSNPEKAAAWKNKGDKVLKEREAARKKKEGKDN